MAIVSQFQSIQSDLLFITADSMKCGDCKTVESDNKHKQVRIQEIDIAFVFSMLINYYLLSTLLFEFAADINEQKLYPMLKALFCKILIHNYNVTLCLNLSYIYENLLHQLNTH